MHFTIFQNKDKKNVIDLFEKVFKKKITEELWQWRYHISRKSISGLLWDDEKLIGYYMLSPVPLQINKNIENRLLAISVMIDPDYQGNGMYFGSLAKFTYEQATKEGYDLIFAFPNSQSYELYFGPLGWKGFGKITEYKKQIEKISDFNESSDYKTKPIKNFDENIDKIWNKHKNDYLIITPRTSEFLNWRFFNHPKFPYENYLSYDYFPFLITKNEEPVAYFVIKKFGQEKCHIVDYFGLLNNDIMEQILFTSELFCLKNKINFISFWMNSKKVRKECKKIISDNGYVEDSSHCFFGCKSLNSNTFLNNKQNWFVTMADSDVF